jgi:hypothetical protein
MLFSPSEKGQGCVEFVLIIATIVFICILAYDVLIDSGICKSCSPIIFPKGY